VFTIIPSGVATLYLTNVRHDLTRVALSPCACGESRSFRARQPFSPVGHAFHRLAIVVVVVGLGHVTHRMHIFHESHVPSQQT
jgi:hypothetical protein